MPFDNEERLEEYIINTEIIAIAIIVLGYLLYMYAKIVKHYEVKLDNSDD